MGNVDAPTAAAFDENWSIHNGSSRRPTGPGVDGDRAFLAFFSIFPLDRLSDAEGFDLGCGFGRMAKRVAPHVGRLHCIDPSAAGLRAAKAGMKHLPNVLFHEASVDEIPLPDGSQDFGYSLGVLHHLPRPEEGLQACTRKLKPDAPFLLYVYYGLENRPLWFRLTWRVSNVVRRSVAGLPYRARKIVSDCIAAAVYWPLSRFAHALGALGFDVSAIPLSGYRDASWATLRADSLDRFGTPVEHRFSRAEVEAMMLGAGLHELRFLDATARHSGWRWELSDRERPLSTRRGHSARVRSRAPVRQPPARCAVGCRRGR